MAMVLRLEDKGGEGGYEWDDGFDYDDVTKIHVQGDLKGIQCISFEYVKAGKPIVGSVHGVSGDGSTKTFEINPSDKEFLVAVNGYYEESTGVIQSIQFTTNKKTSALMGSKTGTKFSLKSTRRKIIGFHGFADKNLNSLGAYFIRVSIKSELIGGHSTGSAYDDGVHDYDGIKKVYIAADAIEIRYFKIDYVKAGRMESHERGDKLAPVHEFAIDYPNEYITALEGTYGTSDTYKVVVITSLFFKTSKGRHSPIFGRISGTRFVLESPGNVIVGFYGRVGACIDGIGAYFSPPPTPLTTTTVKVEAKGGKWGNEWDDGFDYEGVTKIYVRGGLEGIQFIKIEYVKAGQTIVGPIHGVYGEGFTQPFEIKHSNGEYLVAVDGYYDESTGVIQSIQFTTNKETSEFLGFKRGAKFLLRSARGRIVGFHGFADKNLNSLGAYFTKFSIKSELVGGSTTGVSYDDGGYNYDGIRKVYLATDGKQIRFLKIDYDKAGQVESHERGDKMAPTPEFEVDFPNDYITSVEGTTAVSEVFKCPVITSLSFKTAEGKTSPTIGRVIGTKFVLENPGHTIVGFYGRVGACIDSIGAYYVSPPTCSTPPEKLEGKGGDGGDSWDDGAFQNVKKIYVGQGKNGIAAVRFVYGKDDAGEVVKEHGKMILLGYEKPFELLPNEYITSVEGCYDKIFGGESGVLTMLRFKTNKRVSNPYGLETASKFVLEKEGHKITGFHGKASTSLHQIGVHVVPVAE